MPSTVCLKHCVEEKNVTIENVGYLQVEGNSENTFLSQSNNVSEQELSNENKCELKSEEISLDRDDDTLIFGENCNNEDLIVDSGDSSSRKRESPDFLDPFANRVVNLQEPYPINETDQADTSEGKYGSLIYTDDIKTNFPDYENLNCELKDICEIISEDPEPDSLLKCSFQSSDSKDKREHDVRRQSDFESQLPQANKDATAHFHYLEEHDLVSENESKKNKKDQVSNVVLNVELPKEDLSSDNLSSTDDTSMFVNFPDDLRPSCRLPQRLTSRRSTAFFYSSACCGDLRDISCCTNSSDFKEDVENIKPKGCWSWLGPRFR